MDQTLIPGEMGVNVRSIVLDQIVRIAMQQNKTLARLSDGLPLLNSGLEFTLHRSPHRLSGKHHRR